MSETKVNLKLPKHKRPGLRRCGPYRVGREYEVPLDEALHLADVKGFEPTSEADAERLEHARHQQEKAEQAGTSEPSPGAVTESEITDPYAEFLDQGVKKLKRDLDRFTADELEHLVSLEEAGQNRPGAIDALNERLETLRAEAG